MKTLCTLLLCALLLSCINGQDVIFNDDIKMNSISIEFYQPITTSHLDQHFGRIWLSNEDVQSYKNIARKHHSFGFGLSYEGLLSRSTVTRARVGISLNKVSETNNYEDNNSAFQTLVVDEQFDAKQIHFNLFLGLAKRFYLLEKLSIDFGFEIPFITYLDIENKYDRSFGYLPFSDYEEVVPSSESLIKVNYGRALSYGIGPVVKFDYILYRKLFISAESKFYLLHSYVNSPVITSQVDTFFRPEPIDDIISESYLETDTKLSQWEWSKVALLFRIGYRF